MSHGSLCFRLSHKVTCKTFMLKKGDFLKDTFIQNSTQEEQ
jgi:hypothetical protein